MSEIKERLDKVRALIQESEFLEGKGLSNEVNIRIFCYEPENEMVVRHFVNQLETDQFLDCHLIVCNLYKIFLSICDDMDITDAIPDMEEADGSAYLLEQLNSAIGNGEFIDKIQYEPHEPGDVLMLTGVGEVFPFMRIHTLLEALQPYFSDVPILVMYPGEFDGRHVKLFNRLTPNDYYRAFNHTKMIKILEENGRVRGVITQNGEKEEPILCDRVILAIGHSADHPCSL